MSGIEQTTQAQQTNHEKLSTPAEPLVSAALNALESSTVDTTQAAQLRLLAARERKAARRGMVLDEALILESAQDHLERTGRLPTTSCKAALSRYPEWNWVKVNSAGTYGSQDRKSTRLNSSHTDISRMPSSA